MSTRAYMQRCGPDFVMATAAAAAAAGSWIRAERARYSIVVTCIVVSLSVVTWLVGALHTAAPLLTDAAARVSDSARPAAPPPVGRYSGH